jgi:DNA-binding Xre family transcriptional regulator
LSTTQADRTIGYQWHLRMLMAGHGIFATSDLVPLLAARGVVLSREQVYRLVTKVPERLSLKTLVALCDILDCSPADLIEPASDPETPRPTKTSPRTQLRSIKPHRANVVSKSTS